MNSVSHTHAVTRHHELRTKNRELFLTCAHLVQIRNAGREIAYRNFPPAAQAPPFVCQARLPSTHACSGFITPNPRTAIPPLHNSYVIDPLPICAYSRST